MDSTALDLTNITFGYRDANVLHDVSISFAPGRLTAICGPNGSGKSTLLHLAAGQARPAQGHVTLNGAALHALSSKVRAQQLAMLPQTPDAPAELIVRDLVALGRYAYRTPIAGLSAKDNVVIEAALAATDMLDLALRPLAALSGGQRQRAWIAMTLAQEAPWLLLDEPTNHLDVAHAIEAMELLQTLVRRDGKSAVVVLHDINLMARFADDVVLLKDGQIVAAGPFDETETEECMSDVYGRRCRFGNAPVWRRPFIAVN